MQNNRNRNTSSRSGRQTVNRSSSPSYDSPNQWLIWADEFVVKPVKDAWQVLKNPTKPDLSGFKKTRKHRPDYQILVFTGLLMMIGLIIMYAIGPQRANLAELTRQLTGVASGHIGVQQVSFFLA